MNPRSPPARPHIGINLSHFATSNTDWGEDDAWDSTSDSESPRQSTLNNTWNRSSAAPSATAPKMVPKTSSNSSSSTLAFSYTHLQAPSSYPPKTESSLPAETPKNGWTIVRTSQKESDFQSNQRSQKKETDFDRRSTESGDVDVEGDMILGDLEPEANATDTNDTQVPIPSFSKARQDLGAVRHDVDEIVAGIFYTLRP